MNWRGGLRHALLYVVALVAGFSIAYLIVAFFVFPSGVVPRDVTVPNVVGLLYDDAANRLQQAGFKPERGEERFHASAPKGSVLEQSPAPGSHDDVGATVSLTVSSGQQMNSVPNLEGMLRDDAERALDNAGYSVGDVSEEPSQLPRGAVIGTRPGAGTKLPTPNPVALRVSAGPTVVNVPDVVGRNFAQAQLLLQQVGLAVGDAQTETGAPTTAGATVVSQTPAAGAQVARGSRIDLRLSGGE